MINCIECLLQVNKDSYCNIIVFNCFLDFLHDANNGMICRMIFAKTKLQFINGLICFKKRIELLEHEFLKYLVYVRTTLQKYISWSFYPSLFSSTSSTKACLNDFLDSYADLYFQKTSKFAIYFAYLLCDTNLLCFLQLKF